MTPFVVRVLATTGLRWGEFERLEAEQLQGEWIKLDETKTDTPRDVPIDGELARELRAMLRNGARPKYETFRKHLKSAVKACGYSPKLCVHALRHSTATRLNQKGVPTAVIQRFLGHKAIQTTLKYTHVEHSDLLEAAKKLSPQRGELVEKADENSHTVVAFGKTA